MRRNKIIYIVIVCLLVAVAWVFVKKVKTVSDNSGLNNLTNNKMEKTNGNSWTKFANGLEMQDVVVGDGKEAKEGDTVSAHYLGTLSDGKKFDSSYDRGEPFTFVLGEGFVIKGWDLGLVGMRVGGKRKLVIPPGLGYGSNSVGDGIIPPNSTLYFDIELVGVKLPDSSQ